MKVSVIIATYNRPSLLAGLIAKVRQQNIPSEIVVADDGSREPTVVGDKYLWRRDDGFHKTVMVNEAVRMATGNILVFMDDDTRPRSRLWLQAHLKALERGHISRGPFYIGKLNTEGKFEQTSPHIFGLAGTYWSWTNTAMMRDVWNDLEGFDDNFDGHYGFEDIDLGLRIREAREPVIKASHASTAEHVGDNYCGGDESLRRRNEKMLEDIWHDTAANLMERSG